MNGTAATAVYLACFRLGLGAAGPAAGVVVSLFGLPAAFLAAAAAAAGSLLVLAATARHSRLLSG